MKAVRGTLRKSREIPDAPEVETGIPPRPPRHLSPGEKAVWREVARQVGPDGTGIYSPAFYSCFRLAVRALYLVDAATSDTPATALGRYVQTAAGMLSRLGLDPASVSKASHAPKKREPSALDESTVYPGKPRLVG